MTTDNSYPRWSKHSTSYDRNIKTAYNDVCRAFIDLDTDRSISKSYVDHNVHSLTNLLRTRIAGFIDRLLRSCKQSSHYATTSISCMEVF